MTSKINPTLKLILQWAEARNIIRGATPKDQFIKLISELGAFAYSLKQACDTVEDLQSSSLDNVSIATGIRKGIQDDIGDQTVVLTIVSAQLGLEFAELNAIDTMEWSDTQDGRLMLLLATYGKIGDALLKNDTEKFPFLLWSAREYLAALAEDFGGYSVCIEAAYNDIKDRTGVMYNGTFVKSTDARYNDILNIIKVENEIVFKP